MQSSDHKLSALMRSGFACKSDLSSAVRTIGVFEGGSELETYLLAKGRVREPPFTLIVARYLVVSTSEMEVHSIPATFSVTG